ATWTAALQQGTAVEQLSVTLASSQEYVNGTFDLNLPVAGAATATAPGTLVSQTSATTSGVGQRTPSMPGTPAALTSGSLQVGPNIDINRELGDQSEAFIAVDPTNPARVFAASNDNAIFPGMLGAFSTDGGTTWHPRIMVDGTDGLPIGFS